MSHDPKRARTQEQQPGRRPFRWAWLSPKLADVASAGGDCCDDPMEQEAAVVREYIDAASRGREAAAEVAARAFHDQGSAVTLAEFAHKYDVPSLTEHLKEGLKTRLLSSRATLCDAEARAVAYARVVGEHPAMQRLLFEAFADAATADADEMVTVADAAAFVRDHAVVGFVFKRGKALRVVVVFNFSRVLKDRGMDTFMRAVAAFDEDVFSGLMAQEEGDGDEGDDEGEDDEWADVLEGAPKAWEGRFGAFEPANDVSLADFRQGAWLGAHDLEELEMGHCCLDSHTTTSARRADELEELLGGWVGLPERLCDDSEHRGRWGVRAVVAGDGSVLFGRPLPQDAVFEPNGSDDDDDGGDD